MNENTVDYLVLYKRAISESVLDYATDIYTKNYAKHLVELNGIKYRNELLTVVKFLIEWYESNMNAIKHDKFIPNKIDHELSYKYLLLISEQIAKT